MRGKNFFLNWDRKARLIQKETKRKEKKTEKERERNKERRRSFLVN